MHIVMLLIPLLLGKAACESSFTFQSFFKLKFVTQNATRQSSG